MIWSHVDLKHRGAQPTDWKWEWDVAELGVHLGSSVAKDQTRGGRRQVQDQLAAFSVWCPSLTANTVQLENILFSLTRPR